MNISGRPDLKARINMSEVPGERKARINMSFWSITDRRNALCAHLWLWLSQRPEKVA